MLNIRSLEDKVLAKVYLEQKSAAFTKSLEVNEPKVFELFSLGYTQGEIAEDLGLAQCTVSRIISNIKHKREEQTTDTIQLKKGFIKLVDKEYYLVS